MRLTFTLFLCHCARPNLSEHHPFLKQLRSNVLVCALNLIHALGLVFSFCAVVCWRPRGAMIHAARCHLPPSTPSILQTGLKMPFSFIHLFICQVKQNSYKGSKWGAGPPFLSTSPRQSAWICSAEQKNSPKRERKMRKMVELKRQNIAS